jgi:c-di-GMP-binding flagellar brake protein YcgR
MAKLVTPEIGSSVEVLLGKGSAIRHLLAAVAEETPQGIILSSFEGLDGDKLPKPESPVRIRFHAKDAGYEFDSMLLDKRESPVQLAYVANPKTLLRRQLRAYLRVDCEIPVTLVRRDDQRRNAIAGVILNLSGGGALISLMVTIPPDVSVEMKFELPEENRTISAVTAKVLSIRTGSDGSRLHACQFVGIDDEQRTAIVRHTFMLQHKVTREKRVKAD